MVIYDCGHESGSEDSGVVKSSLPCPACRDKMGYAWLDFEASVEQKRMELQAELAKIPAIERTAVASILATEGK